MTVYPYDPRSSAGEKQSLRLVHESENAPVSIASDGPLSSIWRRGPRISFTDGEMTDLLAVFERGYKAGIFGSFAITESWNYEPVSEDGHRKYIEFSQKISLGVFPPDSEAAFVFHKNATGTLAPLYNCIALPAQTLPPLWTPHFGIALSRFHRAVENKVRLLQPERRFPEAGKRDFKNGPV